MKSKSICRYFFSPLNNRSCQYQKIPNSTGKNPNYDLKTPNRNYQAYYFICRSRGVWKLVILGGITRPQRVKGNPPLNFIQLFSNTLYNCWGNLLYCSFSWNLIPEAECHVHTSILFIYRYNPLVRFSSYSVVCLERDCNQVVVPIKYRILNMVLTHV